MCVFIIIEIDLNMRAAFLVPPPPTKRVLPIYFMDTLLFFMATNLASTITPYQVPSKSVSVLFLSLNFPIFTIFHLYTTENIHFVFIFILFIYLGYLSALLLGHFEKTHKKVPVLRQVHT